MNDVRSNEYNQSADTVVQSTQEVTMEVLKTNKNPKIALNGYIYHFQKQCSNFIRWRCYKSGTLKFPSVLKTNVDFVNPVFIALDHEHVHCNNENAVVATKLKISIKEKAQHTHATPSQIFAESACNVPYEVLVELPKEDHVKRTNRNYRGYPPTACRKDLVIESEWSLYNEERFLLDDNGPNANERVLIFATDIGLSLLERSNAWFIDGNFGLAPNYFKQLYVFRVQKNSIFVTAVYCVLERKTQSTYEHLFRTIMNECEKRGKYPDPIFLNMDFELAVINAAKLILDNHITIRRCFYHLCQSTFRKLQELGLSERYKKDKVFQNFCIIVDRLAFLPIDKVKYGMEYLKQNIPTGAEEFLIYFETTYVNGSFRRIGTNESNIRLRRNPPIFPPCTWNVHQTTLSNDGNGHRTNNITKEWSNRFSHLVGIKHPTIWHLLRKIKHEVAADYAKLALDNVGECNTTTKFGQKRTTEKRLQELCSRLVNDEINISEFLNSVGNNLRKRCNN